MASARVSLLAALTLLLPTHIVCIGTSYSLKYQQTKDTLATITKAADTSDQLRTLLALYRGGNVEQCKEQLRSQNYEKALDDYVTTVQSQIEYIDKELDLTNERCGSDSSCKTQASDDSKRDLSALQSKALIIITGKKQELLQKQKDFMDKCVK